MSHSQQDTQDFIDFITESGLRETTLSKDKRVITALILKHNPAVTKKQLNKIIKTWVDDRGIGHQQIADARTSMEDTPKLRALKAATNAAVALPVTLPTPPPPAPVVVAAPPPAPTPPPEPPPAVVASPTAKTADHEPLKYGDHVEVFTGEYYGATGFIAKFGTSTINGAPGARIRPDGGGREFWTDVANLRKAK